MVQTVSGRIAKIAGQEVKAWSLYAHVTRSWTKHPGRSNTGWSDCRL